MSPCGEGSPLDYFRGGLWESELRKVACDIRIYAAVLPEPGNIERKRLWIVGGLNEPLFDGIVVTCQE